MAPRSSSPPRSPTRCCSTARSSRDVKIVASGAGAAAIACLNLLVSLGAQRKNIWVCDIDGVVHEGRNTLMDRWKSVYAQKTDKRKLAEVIGGADIFLGLSAPNVLTPDMVKAMADKPLVMALANPNPEIMPEEARKARPDAMICTGRSDFPNQVNNVLCFPFIFRGALDVRRHRDQRRDEEGRGRCDRAAGARSAGGRDCAQLRQRRGTRISVRAR